MRLSGKQRKGLRAEAHKLRAVVQVGHRGLTDAVVDQADGALLAHELVKVRIAAERDMRERIAERLAASCNAEMVGLIGHVAILYRPHPDPRRRRIQVPR